MFEQTPRRVFGILGIITALASLAPDSKVLAAGSYNILLVSQSPSSGFVDGITAAGHQVTQIPDATTFPSDLSTFHVIILADPGSSFSAPQVTSINAFVNGGKGLILFENTLYDGRFPTNAAVSPLSIATPWCDCGVDLKNRKNRTGTHVIATIPPNPITEGLASTSTLTGGSAQPNLRAGAQIVIKWNQNTSSPADPTDGVPMVVTFIYGPGRVVYINDHDAHYVSANWAGDPAYGTALMRNCVDYAAGNVASTGRKVVLIADLSNTDLEAGFTDALESMPDVESIDIFGQGVPLPQDIDLLDYDVLILAGGRTLIRDVLGDHTSTFTNSVDVGTDKIDWFVHQGGGLILFEEDLRTSDDYFLLEARCNPVQSFSQEVNSRTGTTTTVPDHPLVAGLPATSNLQAGFNALVNITLKSGAQTVVHWNEGSIPMAVAYGYGRGKVVFFNNPSAYDNPVWWGDATYGNGLMVNAVRYVAGSPCRNCGPYHVRLQHFWNEDRDKIVAGLGAFGHAVDIDAFYHEAPSNWALYDAVVFTERETIVPDISFLAALEQFVSEGGGLIMFEPTVFGDESAGGPIPRESPLSPLVEYVPPFGQSGAWVWRDSPAPTLNDRSDLTVGLYGPPDPLWTFVACANPILKFNDSVHMRWAFESGPSEPGDGRPMLVSYAYGAGRVVYANLNLSDLTLAEWGETSDFYGHRLIRNALHHVMKGLPSRACADCNDNGTCDRDEIAYVGAADCDGNGAIDSCDLAAGTHSDTNNNGQPDICEATSHISTTIRHRDDTIAWSTSGGTPTQPDIAYLGPPGSPSAIIDYVYESGKLKEMVIDDQLTTAPNRTITVVYDPANPNEVIGTLSAGCSCAGGAAGNVFTYHDSLGRVTKITTAELPPTSADVLEEFTYVGERMTEHRKRNATGTLKAVERRVYDDDPDGSYTVRIELPMNVVGPDDQGVRREHYDSGGQLAWQIEYDNLVSEGSSSTPGGTAHQTNLYEKRFYVTGTSTLYAALNVTKRPSSVREVQYWRISGTPFQSGSSKVVESYTTTLAVETYTTTSQLDGVPSAQKFAWTKQTLAFNTAIGDYRIDQQQEPSGAITTYTYYDPSFPERLKNERRIGQTGLWSAAQETVSQEISTTYVYDSAGRVTEEIRTGPNRTQSGACTSATDSGCVATKLEYDSYGRLKKRIESYLGTNPTPRITEYRYNGFNEQILKATKLDSASLYLVDATVYDTDGRVLHEYSCEYSGNIDSFDVGSPPVVLMQRTFEYHAVSGRVTKERTLLSDTVPFAFSSNPSPTNDGLTSDTVYQYETTGTWLTAQKQDFDSTAAELITEFYYNAQGSRDRVKSPVGVVTQTLYNGRGLVKTQSIQDHLTTPTLPPLTTTTSYTPDGDIDRIDRPEGTYLKHEYNSVGRLDLMKRCDAADCAGTYEFLTHYEYSAAGHLTRTNVEGVSDTLTDYDQFGRVHRVRRRAEAGITDDDESDGVADEVMLTKYNPASLAEAMAGQLDSGTGPAKQINDYVDQVTRNTYNNLGDLKEVRRLNKDYVGQQIEEKSTYDYDAAGRQEVQVTCLSATNCTGANEIRAVSLYDALGRVSRQTDPDGHYQEQFYDSRGNLVRRISHKSDATPLSQERWAFDQAGRQTRAVVMANAEASTGTAPNAALDRITDNTFDGDGRQLTKTTYNMLSSQPHAESTMYDGLGRVKKVTDPLGFFEESFYDPQTGLLDYREVHDGLDADLGLLTVQFDYDVLARVSAVYSEHAGLETIRTEYASDKADRQFVERRHVQGGQSWLEVHTFYDLLGRAYYVSEANLRTTTRRYDRLGRLKSEEASAFPSGLLQETIYSYDLFGRLVKSVYPDSVDEESDVVKSTYDAAGRLASNTDQAGQTVNYFFNKRGLLERREATVSGQLHKDSFTHDGLGRIEIAERTEGGTLVGRSDLAYDDFSNLEQDQQTVQGASKTIRHEYDQVGNRVCADCPTAGSPVAARWDYIYDALERMASIKRGGNALAAYNYKNSAGGNSRHLRERVMALAGSTQDLVYRTTYDAFRHPALLTNRLTGSPGEVLLAEHSISARDGLGNPLVSTTQDINSGAPGEQMLYSYDELGRLDVAEYPDGEEALLLDPLGNRETYRDTRREIDRCYVDLVPGNEYGGILADYGQSPNYPACVVGQNVSYDAAGNQTSAENDYEFVYDYLNRLIAMKDPSGATMRSYKYDALGRRVFAIVGANQTRFYYDGDRVYAEFDATDNLRRYYLDGGQYVDEHVLMTEDGEDLYYLHGPLYSVSGLVDDAGNVRELVRYDSYGVPEIIRFDAAFASGAGARYLELSLPDVPDLIAIRIRAACNEGAVGYVGNYSNFDSADRKIYRVQDTPPVYKSVADWGGRILVGGVDPASTDLQIVPNQVYEVRLETQPANGPSSSLASFATTWLLGDVNGNGQRNFLDISFVVDRFKGQPLESCSSCADCASCAAECYSGTCLRDHLLERTDFVGTTSCSPQSAVDFLDISAAVWGFQQKLFQDWSDCAEACETHGLATGNPYYFTGQRLDVAVGPLSGTEDDDLVLYHYRARAYDARHGRFLQRDPVGYVDGPNLYEYVRGNPMSGSDPSGRQRRLEMYYAIKDQRERDLQPLRSALTKLQSDYGHREFYKKIGLDTAIGRLMDAIPSVTIGLLNPSGDAGAQYFYMTNTMRLRTGASVDTIFHELIHAHHDSIGLFEDPARADEGVAYAGESIVKFVVPQLDYLERAIENTRHGGMGSATREIETRWRAAWIASQNNVLNGPVIWYDKGTEWSGTLGLADVVNLRRSTGLHLPCDTLAKCYNKAIAGLVRRGSLCIRFVCDRTENVGRLRSVAPLDQLDQYYRE